MLNSKIKVFLFILILSPLNARAFFISAHEVKFCNLTFFALQTYNYINPAMPFWTLYSFGIPIQYALQIPFFHLFNVVLNPAAPTYDPATNQAGTMTTLTGTIVAPLFYQLQALANPNLALIEPQEIVFEVVNSVNLIPGSLSGLDVTPVSQ